MALARRHPSLVRALARCRQSCRPPPEPPSEPSLTFRPTGISILQHAPSDGKFRSAVPPSS
jgi:hypothetical protein